MRRSDRIAADWLSETTRVRIAWFLIAFAVLAVRILTPWRQPVGDPDFWWLSWFGNQWLHGSMPTHNGFSWTAPNTPWITHEPGVGIIDALAGPAYLGLVRCLLLGATWLVLTYTAWRPDGGRALPFALVWAMLLISWGVSERALSWGNLMMAVTVALTTPARLLTGQEKLIGWGNSDRAPATVQPARLALAALAVGIWANLHGSFLIGVMLVGLADWRWGVAAALATLANPHGVYLWGLLSRYTPDAHVGQFIQQVLVEWGPLDLRSANGLLQLGLLLVALPVIWPLRWRPVLLWAIFSAMALRHTRFSDLAGIGLLPWVSAGLARRLAPLDVPSPIPAAAVLIAVAAVVLPWPHFDPARFPPDFPYAKLEGHRVWNEYQLGGYLGAHGVPVFWDPRVDCYPVNVLADGVTIQIDARQRLAVLQRWKVDRVVAWSPAILDPLRHAGWTDDGGAGDIHILAAPRN
jgi:hypothetical protein